MELSNKFNDALNYAFLLHRNQKRKGSDIPYMSHLLIVSGTVLEWGQTEDEVIAALLHDSVEDHPREGKTRVEIREKFGANVLQWIEECSDSQEIPKPPWKERKVKHLKHMDTMSSTGLLISLSDKLHNLGCILKDYELIQDKIWDRFKGGRDGTLWYYQSVANIFIKKDTLPGILVKEFIKGVNRLEEVAGKKT